MGDPDVNVPAEREELLREVEVLVEGFADLRVTQQCFGDHAALSGLAFTGGGETFHASFFT